MGKYEIFDTDDAWKDAARLFLRQCEIGHTVMSAKYVDKYLELRSATSASDVEAVLGDRWATARYCLVCGEQKSGLLVLVENGGMVRGFMGDHICQGCLRGMLAAVDAHIANKAPA